TVATKPAFRSAFKRLRCLVLADGYYEWQRDGKTKLPWLYEVEGGKPFALTGSPPFVSYAFCGARPMAGGSSNGCRLRRLYLCTACALVHCPPVRSLPGRRDRR